ncbi:MAG TPA: hypothetical protein VFH75_03660 [Actinomycetota bacterium]|nr:hypothetical protein [Actinomycetota bacterium]
MARFRGTGRYYRAMQYLLRFPISPVTKNMDRESPRAMPLAYWVIVAALLVLGFLGAASIGLPFFALALLLVLRGIAGRPRRDFWPPVAGIVLFFAAFWGVGFLFGPVSCSTVYSFRAETGPGDTVARTTIDNTRTSCDSPFLPKRIKGEAPPLWPTILSAVGIGIGGAYLTRLALMRLGNGKKPPVVDSEQEPDSRPPPRIPDAGFVYWLVTGAFVVFGFLAIFSIGLPLLALGLALAALSDVRHQPAIFWPPLAGIAVFFIAYILVAPLTCTLTPTPVTVGTPSAVEPQINPMTCTRIALPDYSGVESPALWPSVVAAVVVGVLAGSSTRYLIRKRATRSAVESS